MILETGILDQRTTHGHLHSGRVEADAVLVRKNQRGTATTHGLDFERLGQLTVVTGEFQFQLAIGAAGDLDN